MYRVLVLDRQAERDSLISQNIECYDLETAIEKIAALRGKGYRDIEIIEGSIVPKDIWKPKARIESLRKKHGDVKIKWKQYLPSHSYFSGHFDAEGYVGSQVGKLSRCPSIRITVECCSAGVVALYQAKYGGTTRIIPSRGPKRFATHQWGISGPDGIKFLSSIHKFSLEKRAQVELALRWLEEKRALPAEAREQMGMYVHKRLQEMKGDKGTVRGTVDSDGWFSGHFDGEGCISLKCDGKFEVSMECTCEATAKAYLDRWAGSLRLRPKRRENWKATYVWRLYKSHQVMRFLERIEPNAIIKKDKIGEVLYRLR